MKPRIIFHTFAVLVLLAAVAAAQSTTQKAKPAPANGQHDRESSAPSVSEVTLGKSTDRKSGSVIAADRDAASGQLSGKRQHDPVSLDSSASADQQTSLNSKNSAHATESLSAEQKSQAQTNPMYKDNANQGTNPLFEAKDQTAAKPSGNGSKSKTVEYKDGDDQTTRYRPGNNKAPQ